VRLDDDQTRIFGARRADVTGVDAWEPPCRGIGIAKILKKLQFTLVKAAIRWMSVLAQATTGEHKETRGIQ